MRATLTRSALHSPSAVVEFGGNLYVADDGRQTLSQFDLDVENEQIILEHKKVTSLRVYTSRHTGMYEANKPLVHQEYY